MGELNVKKNLLTVLPDTIGMLESLEELNLKHNQLTVLPSSFGELKSLRKLRLGGNKLCELPENWRNLKALKDCHLGYANALRITFNSILVILRCRKRSENKECCQYPGGVLPAGGVKLLHKELHAASGRTT